DADPKTAFGRVQALTLELIGDHQHVRRRRGYDVGLEIVDELYLPLGHATAHRYHRRTEIFAAVMHAEPAGEQAVAVSIVDLVGGASAGGADRARHEQRPGFDVVSRIGDDRRLAGCAARCVYAHDIFHRHREHAERIVLAQIFLARERKFSKIG